jgi:hypothetical protein
MAARDSFPYGNRAITGTGCRAGPMVNGVRTDMVNERLIWHPARPGKSSLAEGDNSRPQTLWDLSPWDINLQTQPLSSRMASCQIMSMPASLSFRQGIAVKF